MNIWLRIFNLCGQPIFIVLAFLTLPFWFPLLWAWVVIDPPYRMAMWRNKHLKPSIDPISRAPSLAFNGKQVSTAKSHSGEKESKV